MQLAFIDSLTSEFNRILGAGYIRGADAWHLACAIE